MATINLGAIKFNWKGPYNNGTAYAVDDVVSSGGSSYVCILASTGNAVSNGTYWQIMSSAGTDGTDVGATLANKEIAFKTNAGAIDGIPIGTAGQFLKVNSGATGYEYGAVSSDFVKLAGVDLSSSSASSYNFAQFMDDSVYRGYKIMVIMRMDTAGAVFRMRFLNNTTAYSGSTDYRHAGKHSYRRTDNSENTAGSASSDGDGRDYAQMHGWGQNLTYPTSFIIEIIKSGSYPSWYVQSFGRDNSASQNYIFTDEWAGHLYNSGTVDGVQFYASTGDLHNTEFTIWGLKK